MLFLTRCIDIRQVAILCNHQKAVGKGHDGAMEKLQEKLKDAKHQLKELRATGGCALIQNTFSDPMWIVQPPALVYAQPALHSTVFAPQAGARKLAVYNCSLACSVAINTCTDVGRGFPVLETADANLPSNGCLPIRQVGREDRGEAEADRAAGAQREGEGGPEERRAGHVEDQLHGPADHRRMVRHGFPAAPRANHAFCRSSGASTK